MKHMAPGGAADGRARRSQPWPPGGLPHRETPVSVFFLRIFVRRCPACGNFFWEWAHLLVQVPARPPRFDLKGFVGAVFDVRSKLAEDAETEEVRGASGAIQDRAKRWLEAFEELSGFPTEGHVVLQLLITGGLADFDKRVAGEVFKRLTERVDAVEQQKYAGVWISDVQ